MILVISGEGPSDIGACANALGKCSDADFVAGPMMVILDHLLETQLHYSIRELPDRLYFINETALKEFAKALPMRLQPARSKKKGQETGYYFSNALALGVYAIECEQATNDQAIAVLFRDSDSTHSTPTTLWNTKLASMQAGFQSSQFTRGISMLPKPTSEAWLLCAAQNHPYQNCEQLENLKGNTESSNHPKKKLDEALGRHLSATELCDWLEMNPFDSKRAESMPSFKAFKDELERVVKGVLS